jgi:hypothetical protein
MVNGKAEPKSRMASEGMAASMPFQVVEMPAASALSATSGVIIPLLMPMTDTEPMTIARLQPWRVGGE